jgi:hypothetical protein
MRQVEELIQANGFTKGETVFLNSHMKEAVISRMYIKHCCGETKPSLRFDVLITDGQRQRLISNQREDNILKIINPVY